MLRTFEDYLREKGKVTTDLFVCPRCGKGDLPAFALVEAAPDDWICTTCNDADRVAAEQAAAETAAAGLAPWDTELGNDVRAVRVQLQERWRWSVMPDSPLNTAAQRRCMAFLKLLNTLTIDYTSPDDVVWPVEPVLTGDDYDPDA